MKPEKSFYPNFNDSIWLMIRLTVVTFVLSIPMGALFLVARAIFKFEDPIYKSMLLLVIYIVPMWMIIRLCLKRIRLGSQKEFKLPFHRLPFISFLLVLFTGMFLTVVLDPLESLIPMPDVFIDSYLSMVQTDALSFLTVVIVAPVLEEILFRGIILEGFLHNYSPRKAILLSALIFALIHLNPLQMMGAFFIGLFLGWVYWKTHSLVPVIGLHLLNNLLSFFYLMNADKEDFTGGYPVENPAVYWTIIGVAALLGWIGIRMLQKRFKKVPAVK